MMLGDQVVMLLLSFDGVAVVVSEQRVTTSCDVSLTLRWLLLLSVDGEAIVESEQRVTRSRSKDGLVISISRS